MHDASLCLESKISKIEFHYLYLFFYIRKFVRMTTMIDITEIDFEKTV